MFFQILFLNANAYSNGTGEVSVLSNPIQVLIIIIGILLLIVLLFAIWISFLSYKKLKDTDRKIEKSESELKEKMMNFKIETKEKQKEINCICEKVIETEKNISLSEKRVNAVDKSIQGNQLFIKESVENYYDYQYAYANIKGDKASLKLVYIKRAIGNLYSFEEKVRFLGVSVLSQYGAVSDIRHLENISNNLDENTDLKELATYSINAIKNRELK